MVTRPTHDELAALIAEYGATYATREAYEGGIHKLLDAMQLYSKPGRAIIGLSADTGVPLNQTPEKFTAWDTIITPDTEDFIVDLPNGDIEFVDDMDFSFVITTPFHAASNDGLYIRPQLEVRGPLPYVDYTTGEGSGVLVAAKVVGEFSADAGDKLSLWVANTRRNATITFTTECTMIVSYRPRET